MHSTSRCRTTHCFQLIEVHARRQKGQENPRSQRFDKRSTSRQSGENWQICKVRILRQSWPQHTCIIQVNCGPSRSHNKKIAAAISTRVTEDMEEKTGFTCYPAITRTLIPVKQLEIILRNPTISTSNLNVFTAGSQSNLPPTDVTLDTGANCSIVHNSQLLSNMSTCNPVTFDGLSGVV